ncbi:MAG TPA: hypothetical protein VF532_06675 [Candidatus Angelobacter sp.]
MFSLTCRTAPGWEQIPLGFTIDAFSCSIFSTEEAGLSLNNRKPLSPIHGLLTFVLLFFMTLASFGQHAETPEQYVNRLIREASGSQPVRQSTYPRQRAFENAIRTQYRNMVQQNRDFMAAISKIDMEKIKKLLTAESLADPAAGGDQLKELDAYSALEKEHGAKADQSVANLRHTFETADWAAPQRERLLKSFDIILTEPQTLRHRYLDASQAWVLSVHHVYNYAAEYKTSLKVVDGNLQIFDDKVLEELNRRIRLVNSSHQEVVNAEQAYNAMQDERLKKAGVDHKAVGLR